MNWENIFTHDVIDKDLTSKINKQLIQLNIKINQTTQIKWSESLEKHFSEEDKQMASRHMKDVQHG